MTGKVVEVDGRATAVIGVMPKSFVMPGRPGEIWIPLRPTAADFDDHGQWVETLARLKSGVNLKTTQAALNAVAAQLNRERQPKQEKMLL